MPLKISWQSEAIGTQTQLRVPLLGAHLVLSLAGGVIYDASWALDGNDSLHTVSRLADQIKAYLLNPSDKLLKLNLLKQGTPYARKVWEAMLEIPVGEVTSYSALAAKLASGPRAIAQACRNNPYAGIIPCHRVVAKSGIGGFMGQSQGSFVELKRQLLAYERGIAGGRS